MTINPDEFEAGTNVTARVRGEKSGGLVLSVRLSSEDSEALLAMAEESRRSVSDIARQAVRAFLKREMPTSYTVEVTFGTPPSRSNETEESPEPRSDAQSQRQTFGPAILVA